MTAKCNFRLASCALVLSTIALSESIVISDVLATPPTPIKQNNLWDNIVFAANKLWQKATGNRKAGVRQSRIAAGRGTRSTKDESKSDVVALIPASDQGFLGVAATDRPTFWFYLSPTFSELNLKSMTFTLKNQQEKELWSTRLSSGISKISAGLMPIAYKGDQLKADGIYFWELSYQYTDTQQNQIKLYDQKLHGNLQKVTLANLPASQRTPDKISTYARNGIWYDLIDELVTKKQQNPSDRQIAKAFRNIIFKSPDVKYLKINENMDDVELMEEIVTAKVLNLSWSK